MEHLDDTDEEPPNLDAVEAEINIVENTVEMVEEDPDTWCEYCDWKPKSNCADFKRAKKNHTKNKHPENSFSLKAPSNKPKKVNIIQAVADKVEEIKEHTTGVVLSDEEQRLALIEDLNLFRIKFKDIEYDFTFNNDSSLDTLKREKALFMRILQDKVGVQAIFNLLVVGAKGAERITDSLGVADLDGYAGDVKTAEGEIMPILQECVDTGLISSKALTPEIRLAMVMASLAVSRGERNKVLKSGAVADAS